MSKSLRIGVSSSALQNQNKFLRDETGNRRFRAVDVGLVPRTKSIWNDLDTEIEQIWTEATAFYRACENFHLLVDIECTSKTVQKEHTEKRVKEGVIIEFLRKCVHR